MWVTYSLTRRTHQGCKITPPRSRYGFTNLCAPVPHPRTPPRRWRFLPKYTSNLNLRCSSHRSGSRHRIGPLGRFCGSPPARRIDYGLLASGRRFSTGCLPVDGWSNRYAGSASSGSDCVPARESLYFTKHLVSLRRRFKRRFDENLGLSWNGFPESVFRYSMRLPSSL
jgi:hypothetical protein